MKNNLTYLLLFCSVMIFFTSCDNDDDTFDRIVGTWQLTSIEVDGQQQDITDVKEILQFKDNSLFVRYIESNGEKIRGGWSYEGDMLNISVDLPAGYYVVNLTGTELILRRLDFSADGSLRTTIIRYTKTSDNMIP